MNEKKIKKQLEKLPDEPGVYKMLNDEGEIIYIGKAKSLKKRVKQYFQKNYQHSTRTKKLLEKIDDIKFTAVDSELEAIILENNLIKQFLPKYNVIMKDDKNYVYIKITKEEFPQIKIVRTVEKDGAKYIGPKSSAHKVKETFKVLKKLFPFRHCGLDIKLIEECEPDNKVKIGNKVIKYPCLDYFIKRCAAPCIGKCNVEEYGEIIKGVENFLSGKVENVIKDLKNEMQKMAIEKKFEKAAKIRDKISKVENILEKQKVSDPNRKDTDIVNYFITRNKAYFNLFQIRDGKLIGQENFILSAEGMEENEESSEVLESFLQQYYQLATDIAKEILIPHEIDNKKEIQELISKDADKKINLIIPKIGSNNKLLKMSLNNAIIYADRNKPSWQEENEFTLNAIKKLEKILKIKNPLNRIECYDISHLSGTETVGSMIVFEKGAPKNSMYRKFRLRTVEEKPDDYKSMEEVLFRRFSKISTEFKNKEYIFKKSTKKDKELIEKNCKIELEKTDKQFYIIEKTKETKGYIAIKEHSKTVAELSNLWVAKSERGKKLGYKLIKGAISKSKSKRIYVICKEKLREYYLLIGFEDLKKIPKELECKTENCLVYDKNKHKEDESFKQIPDLIIIDGGKGQLSSATKILNDLKIKIPYISLAKKLEEIFTPDKETSIQLEKTDDALKLLQRARDEAHRFAINYNKDLRSKKFKRK